MLNKKMTDYIRNYDGIEVSQGTLNHIDLVCTFVDFINDYTENNEDIIKEAYRLLSVEYDEIDSLVNAQYYDEIDINYINFDDLNDFLNNELFEKMEELAPNGFYFSSHEGDGALFGYWKSEEIIPIFEDDEISDNDEFEIFNGNIEMDIESNSICDNIGFCVGSSCPNWFKTCINDLSKKDV